MAKYDSGSELYVCLDCGQPCQLTQTEGGPEYDHLREQWKGIMCPEFHFPAHIAQLRMRGAARDEYLARWKASPFVAPEHRNAWPKHR